LAYAWLWVLEIDFFVKTLKWIGAGCSGDVPKSPAWIKIQIN